MPLCQISVKKGQRRQKAQRQNPQTGLFRRAVFPIQPGKYSQQKQCRQPDGKPVGTDCALRLDHDIFHGKPACPIIISTDRQIPCVFICLQLQFPAGGSGQQVSFYILKSLILRSDEKSIVIRVRVIIDRDHICARRKADFRNGSNRTVISAVFVHSQRILIKPFQRRIVKFPVITVLIRRQDCP